MALNTNQYFRNPTKVVPIYHAVGVGILDIFASDAVNLRDITNLICINENAAARDLSVYFHDGTNSKLITVISIPGNAGQLGGIPAVKLVSDPSVQMPMSRFDAFGSYFFRIPPGCKLQAKASVGTSLFLIGQIEGFEA